jgi:formylglycine-generating enzyme required for sulfatase activity
VIEVLVIAAAASISASCNDRRPQLLLVVDTDAPVSAQLLTDSTLSPDAVVDTVRIDRFDADWHPVCIDDVECTANFVLPDPSLWPFSFGVATPPGGASTLHLRLRLFRGARAAKGFGAIGDRTFTTIDPGTEATIDRLVEVQLPASGEVQAYVLLSADCLGVPVSLLKPPSTCVDASSRAALAAPSADVQTGEGVGQDGTHAGTWPFAREIVCNNAPPPGDAVCIRGGFSYMGESALAGVDEQSDAAASPPRPVHVDPFWMDRTEVTVGRYRELVNKGLLSAKKDDPHLPDPMSPVLTHCNWLGASEPKNDDYPLNCLTYELASQICEKSGGSLPTEAQWEHAARGRGRGYIYPWGDRSPECCTASAGRKSGKELSLCAGVGPEKVGAHPMVPGACGGLGDVSLDGLIDLGGSLRELCADKLVAYGQGCWSAPGIFLNPRCDDAAVGGHAARGGDWISGPVNTRSTFRWVELNNEGVGFRCVYPGASQ